MSAYVWFMIWKLVALAVLAFIYGYIRGHSKPPQ